VELRSKLEELKDENLQVRWTGSSSVLSLCCVPGRLSVGGTFMHQVASLWRLAHINRHPKDHVLQQAYTSHAPCAHNAVHAHL
jgi:hypothetical protein